MGTGSDFFPVIDKRSSTLSHIESSLDLIETKSSLWSLKKRKKKRNFLSFFGRFFHIILKILNWRYSFDFFILIILISVSISIVIILVIFRYHCYHYYWYYCYYHHCYNIYKSMGTVINTTWKNSVNKIIEKDNDNFIKCQIMHTSNQNILYRIIKIKKITVEL